MRTADFDYTLPEELIAQYPAAERDQSRMLVLSKADGSIEDRIFADLGDYLRPGDLLVFNDSKVMAARLFGRKASGGSIEILIERVESPAFILAHIRANRPPALRSRLYVAGMVLEVIHKAGSLYHLNVREGDIWQAMEEEGHMPLPPYMGREDEALDAERYQTVYCKDYGSAAAPTAGLHFTERLMVSLQRQGVNMAYVTLHVGAGTFQPVTVEDVHQHHMHAETIEVSRQVCEQVRETRRHGGRVIAVGTTTVRSLETAAQSGAIQPYCGNTDIFLYPGKPFYVTDALITNFHLPQSTLLMLVSAFASTRYILDAYAHAVSQRYRFYSYGDSMLIMPTIKQERG